MYTKKIHTQKSHVITKGYSTVTVSGYCTNTTTNDVFLFTTGHGILSNKNVAKKNKVSSLNDNYTFVESVDPDCCSDSDFFNACYYDSLSK
jgi:hypothetical protein